MKPKYFRTDTSVKTIDILTKEWVDKMYGNTYFSNKVTVNLGLKNEFSFCQPFQYGSGSQSGYEAFKELKRMGVISSDSFRDLYTQKILVRSTVVTGCTEKEVM